MKRHNVGILVGAVLILIGFSFGWLGLSFRGGSFSITGWEIARVASERGLHYYLLYLLPVGALFAGFAALKDRRLAANVGTVVGGAFTLWAGCEIVLMLWRTTFLGLWLTVAGTLTLLAVGLVTRIEK